MREAARALDPDQPLFAVQPLDDVIAEARWPYRVFGSLFVIFAVIALVLSSVGIYAITLYSVSQRTAELGLRLALGAQGSQISWLILRTGLIQLSLGLAIGLAAAWGVSQILKSLVAQIPALDPVTFVGITLLLTTVMLTACLIPARRATRMDSARRAQSRVARRRTRTKRGRRLEAGAPKLISFVVYVASNGGSRCDCVRAWVPTAIVPRPGNRHPRGHAGRATRREGAVTQALRGRQLERALLWFEDAEPTRKLAPHDGFYLHMASAGSRLAPASAWAGLSSRSLQS